MDWAKHDADDKVTFRGHEMCAADAAAHLESERKFGAQVVIVQGGFNPGGVAASGGAHDEGGALDWSVSGMSPKRKRKWDHVVKDVGWCAWHRVYIPNLWSEHEHGIRRGCTRLSPVAADQVPAFDQHLDGLVSGNYDPSYRPSPRAEFHYGEWRKKELARRRLARISEGIRSKKRTIRALRHRIATARDRKQHIRGTH